MKTTAEMTTIVITVLPVVPGHPTVMKASIAREPITAERAITAIANPCNRPGRDGRGEGGT